MSVWHKLAGLPADRRAKWVTAAVWLLLAVLAVSLAGQSGEDSGSDTDALPANAESTKAVELADRDFPPEPEQLLLVYARDGGITPTDRAAATADASALRRFADGEIPPPIPSEDGDALLVMIRLAPEHADDAHIGDTLATARDTLAAGRPTGLDARVTGGAAASTDFSEAFNSVDTTLLLATVVVVAVLLLLTYRSPILLLIPLLSVGLASQLASAVVKLLSKYGGLVADDISGGILTVLIFGVGTDYALLLISRYREELTRHADRHEAMRVALTRAVPAVAASAVTVILALVALTLAELNSTRGLGPIGAIGIACALLVMTTLLPALLVVCGRWIFWPRTPRFRPHETPAKPGVWARVAGAVSRHSRPIWLVAALALAATSLGTTQLSTGLERAEAFVTKPDSVLGQELLAAHFPAGATGPSEIFAPAASAERVATAARAVPGIAQVDTEDATTSRSGDWVRYPVILDDEPETQAAEKTVERLRAAVHDVDGAVLVGGTTAERLDVDDAMNRDLRLILPLILLIVLGVLMVLLRAVVAPLLLLASVVLSFAAALGAATLVFHAIGHPTIDRVVLLYGFLFVVALGVDYTIFLMARAREETAALGNARAVERALASTGAVIISAGLVLAGTFSVLSVMPIVFMVQIGILVAIGVLLDAFVAASLLVPSLVTATGRRTWWPGRLAREPRPDPDPVEGRAPLEAAEP
ncbi:MMPL family transporter [Phytohabitans aurantiacus]|jgi:RND superfamily putative drug exporter|uniref:Membrane protein ActII-3 n=1 Tax=Phytohabitans aurantiacus TaxID=3016789 RepID=A0ABQ5QYS6_9ACTN|nr:MMPL family transporter [Phytohabitans aurantiacus]GLH99319.1 putative membrane protein ActII-3 [Phytohabitans aurantiacus]